MLLLHKVLVPCGSRERKLTMGATASGVERAYKDRLGKDWSPRQSRHSVPGWRSIRRLGRPAPGLIPLLELELVGRVEYLADRIALGASANET
jgi:hypothetical protein